MDDILSMLVGEVEMLSGEKSKEMSRSSPVMTEPSVPFSERYIECDEMIGILWDCWRGNFGI
jgi:hypothetical protein